MSYNNLSECTLTPDERVAEKDRIMLIFGEQNFVIEHMTDVELGFIKKIEFSPIVSVKQLFWLRDLKDKYL